ncbi:MAG: aminomethyl transferase family protein [Desulfobacterales bacterium]|nr:aminomethyl transferase family protein [Desulfobacterales bacterium]
MKTTPLHDWHTSQGANMAVFGEYHMPMWYAAGAKKEHLSVLTTAGLFDTSHMAVVLVAGAGAFDLLQATFTNNLAACIGPAQSPLAPGCCVYGAFLDEKGHVIDDAIVFQLAAERYMVVVNAGMGAGIAAHLYGQPHPLETVRITDMTDRLGKIDIQGPAAAKILSAVLQDPDAAFKNLPYFAFKGYFETTDFVTPPVLLESGSPVLVSRTGYTGEFGFELFVPAAAAVELWEALLAAGEPFGLVPCGLAARDSLRAGAVLPLSHQDIGHWPFRNNPWPFALPWDDSQTAFTKSFVGSQALLGAEDAEHTLPYAGHDLRKVTNTAETAVIDEDGNTLGTVLTCATDMGIGRAQDRIYSLTSPDKPEGFKAKGLCCGFVKVSANLPAGTRIYLQDNRRKLKAIIVDDVRPDRTARRRLNEML